jgi:PadR family transcriptional regulator PadR
MDDTQLLKGILEGCVLSVIGEGETYGYEILSRLEEYGFENLIEGTLYPVLTRLYKKGLLKCRKEKSPLGPIRKYYSITTEGMEWLEEFKNNFIKITNLASNILHDTKEKR